MDWGFFWALVRILILLPLVLVLAYLATRYAVPWRYGWPRRGSYLAVVEHLALGARAGLYVIRVGTRHFLFAAGERGLVMLRELDDYPQAAETPGSAGFWSGFDRWRKEKGSGAP